MAHFGSKGWYVAELKKLGITRIDGYKLETFKIHVLRKAYLEATKQK